MRVRMKVRVSGTRNGQAWPAKGGTIDLPEAEAAALVAVGAAEPEPEGQAEEQAGEPEQATAPDRAEKRPARRGRSGS
ncbi:hypothetical protein [Streptomyces carpaticus]|uniref:hypothetical protein n=1 Tax=Streptomyces carpaticus TaxID=285558 RepID=UPI0031F8BE0F